MPVWCAVPGGGFQRVSWFRVDDGWARHPKVRKAGKDGRALWMTAGSECAAARSDGHVPSHLLADYAYLADVPHKGRVAAQRLVEAGLWHDSVSVSNCPHEGCKQASKGMDPGGWLFHDWSTYQQAKSENENPEYKRRAARKRALLRNQSLCSMIQERDRGLCRYCGERVRFGDQRSALGGTYDHVDPYGGNDLDNVVVACRRCNGIKRDRTPDEAEMPLRPIPAPWSPHPNRIETGSEPDSTRIETDSDRNEPSRARRDGSGRDSDRIETGEPSVIAECMTQGDQP